MIDIFAWIVLLILVVSAAAMVCHRRLAARDTSPKAEIIPGRRPSRWPAG